MNGTRGTWSTLIERVEAAVMHKAELDFATASERFDGAEARRFGPVLATRLPDLPDRVPYNKARPCRSKSRHRLKELLAFYVDGGLRPALEVWAADATTALHEAFLDVGLTPAPPAVTLHAATGPVDAPAGVEVVELHEDDPRYADTLFRGYRIGPEEQAFRAMTTIEHGTPGLRRYLAFVDGRPAAAASMFAHDGVSLFTGAATVPAYRRHGCQTALIARRLSDAADHGDLAVATAAFASPSHDNLSRAGFQVTHTRTIWR